MRTSHESHWHSEHHGTTQSIYRAYKTTAFQTAQSKTPIMSAQRLRSNHPSNVTVTIVHYKTSQCKQKHWDCFGTSYQQEHLSTSIKKDFGAKRLGIIMLEWCTMTRPHNAKTRRTNTKLHKEHFRTTAIMCHETAQCKYSEDLDDQLLGERLP